MNELIDVLKKKVNSRYQRMPEFSLLQSIVRKQKMGNLKELDAYLTGEIREYKRKLGKMKAPTENRFRTEYAKWIDALKLMREMIRKT